jgi:hypothetical protein
MADRFEYSAYVAFHPDDVPMANELISKMRSDGLRVCSDGSDPREGETPQQSIERYLQTSRTMVLLVSSNSLGQGWTALERRTSRFRDPKDPKRRFVPVIVDDCRDAITEAMRQYGFIDLRRRTKSI